MRLSNEGERLAEACVALGFGFLFDLALGVAATAPPRGLSLS